MLYKVDCKADIAVQDPDEPTYIGVDCDLHTKANDVGAIKTYSFVGGTGYAALQVLTVVQTGASGGTFRIDTVDGSGIILTMTQLDKGVNYTVANNLATTVDTGGGSGATISILTINTGFYGKLIDCELSIIVTLATACKDWNQGIRTTVLIDGVDVTDALVGAITINHNKNMISTFSLSLGDTQYSPLTNSHIASNKVVVITSYLNRHEARLFTGLIDDISVDYTLDEFKININGSDYGKKLRNKRATLISIQDSVDTKYRGSIIKYMAEQAEITSVDAPQGSYTRIDHSFEDQTILDMITKELVIDSYWWRFDEDGTLKIALDEIKTSTGTYPTPDWTYGEDRFIRLGLADNDEEVINTLKILGTVYETKIIVAAAYEPKDSPYMEYTEPAPTGYTTIQLCNFNNSFASGEDPTSWSATDGYFTLTVTDITSGWWQPPQKFASYKFRIDCNTTKQEYEVDNVTFSLSGYINFKGSYNGKKGYAWITASRTYDGSGLGAFSISFGLVGKKKYAQTSPEENPPTSAIIDNTPVSAPTYEYHYDQVAVSLTDASSIAKYGERKPNTEGTLEFPFAENVNQCEGIGRKIIRDSHRFMKQPDFEIPFNPMLKVGQTVSITDKKIGYNERWYVEEVVHSLEQSKGRTRIGCVYYA